MNVLGIDIGGSGVKGAIVDTKTGVLISEKIRFPTPDKPTPKKVLDEIKKNIIQKLQNVENLTFNFEQNINDKKETGTCTIKYPKKIFCEYFDKKGKIFV